MNKSGTYRVYAEIMQNSVEVKELYTQAFYRCRWVAACGWRCVGGCRWVSVGG